MCITHSGVEGTLGAAACLLPLLSDSGARVPPLSDARWRRVVGGAKSAVIWVELVVRQRWKRNYRNKDCDHVNPG